MEKNIVNLCFEFMVYRLENLDTSLMGRSWDHENFTQILDITKPRTINNLFSYFG